MPVSPSDIASPSPARPQPRADWRFDGEEIELQRLQALQAENDLLRKEIRVSRESAEITANLVVKQFEETERVLRRYQETNAQRKAVLDSASHIAIMATDSDGHLIVFNKGAENLLAYRAAEVIGRKTPLAFHRPEEIEQHARALSKESGRTITGLEVFFEYARQGRVQQQEWTYVGRDGNEFPVRLSINGLQDPGGAVSGFLCIAADITDAKLSEEARLASEHKFRRLIDNIPNIVFKGYADGRIEFIDNKIEALTGYGREVFNSGQLKWTDLILPEDRGPARQTLIEALRRDGHYIREYRIRKKDGEIAWLQVSGQIDFNEEGRIKDISGAFLDITKRKQAEAALDVSEEKYRSLFTSGPNPIFVLDSVSLEILDVNPAALLAYGYEKAQLLGRRFSELGEFEIPDMELPLEERDHSQDACFINQRARHWKKDGTPFYIRVKACPITYEDRQALILAATDITESIEKDAQLFQASKMTTLGEMSAGIAHELNQPLNAIKIGNDYLLRLIQQGKPISAVAVGQVAEAVAGQVERASDIIQRLREFGRQPDFKLDPVNLNTVVTNVTQIIGQQLALINIHLHLELQSELPAIFANGNRLEQVVFNLITNARDAIELLSEAEVGERGRHIRVHTFSTNKAVVCRVVDTGIGIPSDKQEKIFEPFFTTKEVGKGMGLGLAISYGIVRDYGGTINLKARADGTTCFELMFPRTE
jgi:PAS domain S-box-containing protein